MSHLHNFCSGIRFIIEHFDLFLFLLPLKAGLARSLTGAGLTEQINQVGAATTSAAARRPPTSSIAPPVGDADVPSQDIVLLQLRLSILLVPDGCHTRYFDGAWDNFLGKRGGISYWTLVLACCHGGWLLSRGQDVKAIKINSWR